MAIFGGALSKALSTESSSDDGQKEGLIQRAVKLFKKRSAGDSKTSSTDPTEGNMADPSGFRKGGKVKKTGLAKVHRGEKVLTRKQARKYGPRKRA